jgi:flagellar biosynthetic protein FliP
MRMKKMHRQLKIIVFTIAILFILTDISYGYPDLSFNVDTDNYVSVIQIMVLLTVLTFAPAILIMMTSFTRIIIVLSFIRNAIGTQQTPPNQVLIGLALFLTFFIMSPIATEINEQSIQPYLNNEIKETEAIDRAMKPIRKFMFKQTKAEDLALFLDIAEIEKGQAMENIPTSTLIPAFIISELRTAFKIGFMIFIPFLVIDMVVASTLMSMGMMMLPPVMISLPFKILLFILVDGWSVITKVLVTSFR